MGRFLRFTGFIISWFGSLAILYINHIVLTEAGSELDMFGFLVSIVIVFSFVKWVDKRANIADIQGKYKLARLTWNNGKRIVTAGLLTWLLFVVEDNVGKLQMTGMLITACFVVGYLFTLWGNLINKKATS